MSFELFSGKRSHGGPPAVTITKNGMFVINSTALSKHIKPHHYVEVYWDKDLRKVGLKPIAKRSEKAYNLHFSAKGKVASMSASAFLKHIEYGSKPTSSFPANWNEGAGLLEFTIMETERPKRIRI